ncbi:MAG TPA: cyanophycin synthetase, partial [Steroidobacteraceae bacterium]
AMGATLLRLGVDFDFERAGGMWTWRSLRDGTRIADLPAPALTGDAQYDNASAALQALHCLNERLPASREAIESGLKTVALPGRFQRLPGAAEWILDVAHNPAAARTLAEQLRKEGGRRTWAVCGILADKDIEGIARELQGCFVGWIAAGLDGPRALDPQQLAERLSREGATIVGTATSVRSACELADRMAESGDRIVVFGSFLTVGPALEWLEERVNG